MAEGGRHSEFCIGTGELFSGSCCKKISAAVGMVQGAIGERMNVGLRKIEANEATGNRGFLGWRRRGRNFPIYHILGYDRQSLNGRSNPNED